MRLTFGNKTKCFTQEILIDDIAGRTDRIFAFSLSLSLYIYIYIYMLEKSLFKLVCGLVAFGSPGFF